MTQDETIEHPGFKHWRDESRPVDESPRTLEQWLKLSGETRAYWRAASRAIREPSPLGKDANLVDGSTDNA